MNRSQKGFSLAEVLMATGVLALGLAFIAGVFPAGIQYSIHSTERTMASVVGDEAFAKIKLYGVDVNSPPLFPFGLPAPGCSEFLREASIHVDIPQIEFGYPSAANILLPEKTYFWSAICRRVSGVRPGQTLVQVTVFVSRKTVASVDYYKMDPADVTGVSIINGGIRPSAVKVAVTGKTDPLDLRKLLINNTNDRTKIPVGSTIVDNMSGKLYRVLDRVSDNLQGVVLDKIWEGPSAPASVWVVPPPVGGGRYPCVGVFQKEILF